MEDEGCHSDEGGKEILQSLTKALAPRTEPLEVNTDLVDNDAEDDIASLAGQAEAMGRKLRPIRRRRYLKWSLGFALTLSFGVLLWWMLLVGHSTPPSSSGSTPGGAGVDQPEERPHIRPQLPPNQLEMDCRTIVAAGPRVGGSASHGFNVTHNLIVGRLQQLGWAVEVDSFTTGTVLGPKTFHNIIATGPSEAQAKKAPTLVLAAHYDSKLFANFEFVGATDSAASCALLLDIAANLTVSPPEQRIMLIFFDGEEAFQEWTATDSIYGARHLAAKWQKDGTPSHL
eukprot:EG_transcript_6876